MRFHLLVIFLVALLGTLSNASTSQPNYFVSKWSNLEVAIRSRFNSIFDRQLANNLSSYLNQTFESEISSTCKQSLLDLVNSLQQMDLWAIKSKSFKTFWFKLNLIASNGLNCSWAGQIRVPKLIKLKPFLNLSKCRAFWPRDQLGRIKNSELVDASTLMGQNSKNQTKLGRKWAEVKVCTSLMS